LDELRNFIGADIMNENKKFQHAAPAELFFPSSLLSDGYGIYKKISFIISLKLPEDVPRRTIKSINNKFLTLQKAFLSQRVFQVNNVRLSCTHNIHSSFLLSISQTLIYLLLNSLISVDLSLNILLKMSVSVRNCVRLQLRLKYKLFATSKTKKKHKMVSRGNIKIDLKRSSSE
jgi:hypothetical protein